MSHDFSPQINSAPYSPASSHFSHQSMADPNVQQQSRQQTVAYPSPHSYPSPSMQPTYTYPPPQGQQTSDAYRGSPQSSNMSLPPLNLPPIRLQDGQQPQAQPQPAQQQQQQPMGSPLPPPPPHGMPQYYPHPAHAQPGQPMMANMGPQFNAMRYQLPPQGDQRVLSGGRHKKEIKRRTKTGCLTCRKRRIKCDEAHPMCRNCQKSKRECLGYDPIFKQQSGPAQIQPAPNAAPASQAPNAPPAPAPPASAYSQSPVPQGYAPASSAGYASAAPATSGEHQPASFHAIDPALAQADPALQSTQHYNAGHAMDPAMRGPPGPNAYPPPPEPLKGKRLHITDIFGICNHSPPEVPPRTSPVPREIDDEFSRIFINDYCQGLDIVLETTWFSTENNALNRVFSDRALHEEAAYFTETIKYKASDTDMTGVFSQEARLLWHLLGTCKHNPPATNGATSETDDFSLREARARFDVLEALLTNQNLAPNPVRELTYPANLDEETRMQVDFWMHLGDFVQYSDSDTAPPGAADNALAVIRSVLRMHEVRDAIYSIAIARHYGSRIGGFPNALPAPVNQAPESDLNKLLVAMSFISHESRAASQQVLARICDMAMFSWTASRMPSGHQPGGFQQ
ncbi:hypothetical protein COCCADRAFT_7354 [Bipolaris zeicola 26-R-13]|uniref:Zn(2)-C6 fungal-type domain-containing protein n=1 Tax=Cochliobolus carbonum (strain 26-R-13) TaxID=930089 RepID=W6XY13_COCC2|nr:uncharacterized protein COCCADRAFT_7354 [Bipolaris zeicola 26-R-13]EUC30638.1 hypothetical protein COCCADRAFT_7354 [Bipolaris zeicola 26-R-13]